MQLLNDVIRSNYDFWDFGAFQKGRDSADNQVMTFDWEAAVHKIKSVRPKIAKCGLQGDFAQTAKVIYENGKAIINEYIRTSSTWAKPLLVLDNKVYECFLLCDEDVWSNWTEKTLGILGDKSEVFN